MGINTRLRVEKGIELTPVMSENLSHIIGPDFDVVYFDKSRDLRQSYVRRMEVFEKAFCFIQSAIPLKKAQNFESYLNWCKAHCELPADATVSEYQQILSQYTALLVDALVDYWEFQPSEGDIKEQAMELLNKSEQYITMSDGRQNLATLTSMTINDECQLVLQFDKQLTPYTEETLKELRVIKNSEMSVTPEWFRALPSYQQVFFHALQPQDKTRDLIKSELNELEIKWRQLQRDKAPEVLSEEIRQIAQGYFPEWFSALSPSQKALIQQLSYKTGYLSEIDDGLKNLSQFIRGISQAVIQNIEAMRPLPYWYLRLPEFEQRLFRKSVDEVKHVEDAFSFLPSRLRTLPLVANFAEHHLLLLNNEGKVSVGFDRRMRSSHMASRDVKNEPPQIGDLHCDRNLSLISQNAGEKALFVQTLISPVYYLSSLPDYSLNEQRRRAVPKLKREANRLIETVNHPFNIAKRFYPTKANDPECLSFLNSVDQFFTPKSIQRQAVLLGLPESEFLCNLTSNCVRFINHSDDERAFDKLMQFVADNLVNKPGWTEEKFSEIISAAFNEASLIKQSGGARAKPVINSDDDIIKQKLITALVADHAEINSWKNWQSVVAGFWCMVSNHSDKDASFYKFPARFCDLVQLRRDYNALLNSGYLDSTLYDYTGRELWLSSLENLITLLKNDMSYGSCVSGKDRKALELIHTDAMLIYHTKYGCWPNKHDTGVTRENFVEIVADLYINRHMHEHAGENARGADGIKTPSNYFPEDIVLKICEKLGDPAALKIDDILATNNEVDRITNIGNSIKKHYATCVMASLQLTEECRTELIDQLKIVVEEQGYWMGQKRYHLSSWQIATPKGVDEIKRILDNSATVSSSKLLADCLHAVQIRPDSNSSRTKNTQTFYNCLKNIYRNPKASYNVELENLKSMKTTVFESSQLINS